MDVNAVTLSFNGSKKEDVEEVFYTYVNSVMRKKSDEEKVARSFAYFFWRQRSNTKPSSSTSGLRTKTDETSMKSASCSLSSMSMK